MKLIVALLVLSLVEVQASVYSQSKKFTFDLHGKPIREVLKSIEQNSKFKFFYNEDFINVDKVVDLRVEEGRVEEVLDQVLANTGISYQVLDNDLIVLTQRQDNEVPRSKAIKITGKISDGSSGEAVAGAIVSIKGTNKAVVADAEGKFSIEASSSNDVLVISMLGYVKKELPIGNTTDFAITLEPDVTAMEEVVVIGYGVQKKRDLTGAVAVVNNNDFKNTKALSIGEAMQGLASGVQIRSTGAIGSEPNIEIRGIGNFGNHQPLYVIDGVISTGGIRDLNVNDIESIQILKDASAAAIYGNRAANGVIIITTKKGNTEKLKVDFSSKFSIDRVPRMNLMDTTEFFKYNDMAYRNAGLNPQNHYKSNTDWQDETFQIGNTQDYNLSFSGKGQNNKYYVSLNYLNNTGTTRGTEMERYSFRVNTESKRGIFTIGENLAISEFRVVPYSGGNPFYDAMRMTPDIPVYDSTHPGGYGYGDEARARTFGTNPVAIQNLVNNRSLNTRIRGDLYGEARLTSALTYKLNLGYETSFDAYRSLRKSGNWQLNQPADSSSLYENKARYISKLIEHTLNYNKVLDKHEFNGVIGMTYQIESYEQIYGSTKDIVRVGDYYYDVLNAGRTNPIAGGFRSETRLLSYLGRLNYNYDNRYLFSAVIRRDASSKFAKSHRVGYFPSLSIGWRISKENFFNINWITDLKLRASYGVLGNAAIENWGGNSGQYAYQSSLTYFPMYTFGEKQVVYSGMIQRRLVNEDIHWETKIQQNYGFDLAVLQNRLQFSIDYFIATSKDVLVEAPILLATGNDGGNPMANAASLENRGFEFNILWKDKIGEVNYGISTNLTTLKNKVLDLGYGKKEVITNVTKTEVGQPIGMFYLIKTDGIFKSQEEVMNNKTSTGVVIVNTNGKLPEPGDVKYIDYDDNGIISSSGDRQIVGNPWPKFEVGLNLYGEYKNFDLTIQGFGAFGQKVWNLQAAVLNRFDDNSNYIKGINPWTPENPNTDFPRLLYGDDRNARGDQDRWLEDGSFFKIRVITFGYTIKPNKYFDQLRLSLSFQNYLTFTKYTGLDPEFVNGNVYERGVDPVSYPTPKSIIFSCNITF